MSGQSTITRTLIAAAAALFMSSVAIGTAVAPAHAIASPTKFVAHA